MRPARVKPKGIEPAQVGAPAGIGTDLSVRGAATHGGHVDVIDSRTGIRGWAVNLANPMDPVRLELCVGGQVVAATLAKGEREDISRQLGQRAVSGFHFDHAAIRSLIAYVDDPEDMIFIRVAATSQVLPSADSLPRLADIIAELEAEAAQAARANNANLQVLLQDMRDEAERLAAQPLRAQIENLQGYIETLAEDGSGNVWFMGWMRKGHPLEFAGVVADDKRFPAAVAVMSYLRDDLPDDCSGIIGMISSPWRPTTDTIELNLFFGTIGRFYLRDHRPLRLLPVAEFVAEFDGIKDRLLGDGRTPALQAMLTSLETWHPAEGIGQTYATRMSIDRIMLVPGLGCLVEGWILSPMKRIEALRLRVGASVMSAYPDSLFWKPRIDLLGPFPGSERMAQRAGFVGLFSGNAEPEDFIEPVLKIIFEGGASANWAVPQANFRRLGHSASIEDTLMFFPALQEEVFFPRFAEAAIRAERAAMTAPVKLALTRSRRVMILVLPEDRCDLFLLFETLAAQCRAGEDGETAIDAIAFIAADRSNRSDALWMFREFQATHGLARNIACSLMVIEEAAHAFALLPEILKELGANRFFFAAAGVFLNESGWTQMRRAMTPGAADLVFFGIEDETFQQEQEDGLSARCFAWSAGHFVRWSMNAPSFLGGYHRENGLARGAAYTVHRNAAQASRTAIPSKVEEAVNASVYRAMSQGGMPVPLRAAS